MNGQLEFYNVDEGETMATGEHFMCTDIEWDPTGVRRTTGSLFVGTMQPAAEIQSRSACRQLFACRRHVQGACLL